MTTDLLIVSTDINLLIYFDKCFYVRGRRPDPSKENKQEVPVPELVSYSQFGNFDIYSKYFLVL